MNGTWQRIIRFITDKADTIQADFSVNPYIFLALLVACAPFFYYSIYRLARSVAAKKITLVYRSSAVFLAATSLPYLYVLAFGKNLPWWIYLIFGVLIAQAIVSLIRKLIRGRKS